ncbi:MAG TPA: response regulator transcription factor [Terriglobales bacterium]
MNLAVTTAQPICVLVVDSSQMKRQLLVGALRRRAEYRLLSCELDMERVFAAISENRIDVALVSGASPNGAEAIAMLRRIHITQPHIAQVVLLENPDRETVVSVFRSGAQGLFWQSKHPFSQLCKCVQTVHRGEVWICSEHLIFLVDAVKQVPGLRLVNGDGLQVLTPREEQVVALVADGMSNRDVARELRLSEHTIKKYLFRIFDKVGVSNRVELVLYAVNHAHSTQAEWIPAAAR